MPDKNEPMIQCPSCHKEYRWQEKLAGKKVRCKCGAAIAVPASVVEDDNTIPLAIDDDVFGLKKPAAAPKEEAKSALFDAPSVVNADPGVAAAASAAKGYCPSCKGAVKPTAVICLQCGYNLKANKQLSTATGGSVRASTGPVNGPRRAYNNDGQFGFMARLQTSGEIVKMSYGIIWDFKLLTIFPILSAICAILVSVSYLLPVFMIKTASGDATEIGEMSDDAVMMQNIVNVALGLGFYFVNYFVIVFFNTGLTACTMKVTAGETPTLGYGLSIAVKRLPQIIAWALVSAIVGQLIKILESQKTIGKIMAVVMGTGWNIITFFVVPVLCVEGVGPFKAIKQSFLTIRETWGESLLGNTAVGVINFLLSLPLIAVIAVGVYLMMNDSASVGLPLAAVGVIGLVIFAVVASAADGVFRALLYNYATGRSLPADVDEDIFSAAFANKGYDS